jgi:hypothetical protein
MIRLRLTYTAGRKLAWSAQRPQDWARLDFAPDAAGSPAFAAAAAAPATPTRLLVAETGIFSGRYNDQLGLAPGVLWDGPLIVTIHDLTDPANPLCLGEGVLDCFNGASRQDYTQINSF